jgi:hypothetical protein
MRWGVGEIASEDPIFCHLTFRGDKIVKIEALRESAGDAYSAWPNWSSIRSACARIQAA